MLLEQDVPTTLHRRAHEAWDSSFEGMKSARLAAARQTILSRLEAAWATFGVHGEDPRQRTWMCDALPRVIDADSWAALEAGLVQRVSALEAFVTDIYSDQNILSDDVIPAWLVASSRGYLPGLRGTEPSGSVWLHVAGIDLLEAPDGSFLVIEDNLRVPSGVAYALVNRTAMMCALPELAARMSPAPIGDYVSRLERSLQLCTGAEGGRIVVLTPGRLNGAYFEHAYLARGMGAELVEGSDLEVDASGVWLRDSGERVDAIYRRVDDPFLDPVCLRPDSLVGVPGLLSAWRTGKVVIASAPGVGVADDKGLFPFVPDLIRYYLGETPLLTQPRTLVPWREMDLMEIRARLTELVLKPVWGAGGEGIVFGDALSPEKRVAMLAAIERSPRTWIAQEVVDFSRGPVVLKGGLLEQRRLDLRPFVVTGPATRWVLPGGLTRVASGDGMLVNSSQGGGSKDTWVCSTS
jgi:uncharacterized circularly permuted ATP-grasp superfamily protein